MSPRGIDQKLPFRPPGDFVLDAILSAAGVPVRSRDRETKRRKLASILQGHPDGPALLADPRNPALLNSDLIDVILGGLLPGETYFFRNRLHAQVLRQHLLPLWGAGTKRLIKIWSAGCSSGEEPYTLNMIVKQFRSRWGPGDLRIYASDINDQALKAARRAEYSEWSLRMLDPAERARYFEIHGESFVVKPEYRELCLFFQHNLCHDPFPSYLLGIDQMQLILCRNVLMYLPRRDIPRVVDGFTRSLAPGGFLLVGSAESHLLASSSLTPVPLGGLLLYQRPENGSGPATDAVAAVQKRAARQANQPAPRSKRSANATDPEGGRKEIDHLLALARLEFSSGAFQQAEILIQSILSLQPLCEEAYYHLGLLYAEQARPDHARDCLRRCLFLNPQHAAARHALKGLGHGSPHNGPRTIHSR